MLGWDWEERREGKLQLGCIQNKLKGKKEEEKEEQEKAESQYNPFREMQQDKTGLNQNGGEEDES